MITQSELNAIADRRRELTGLDVWYDGDEQGDQIRADLDALLEYVRLERKETASKLRDIVSRIGVACTREWIISELERLANQLEHWAKA